ncbi:MAG: hypothetical protein WD431_17765 [Cyclobacteriaceae bacterium]
MMKSLTVCLLFSMFWAIICCNPKKEDQPTEKSPIQPWSENPFYWEYRGNPILLLGGTIDDNLFQINHLQTHLDSLAAIGGNYVRNTMSDRDEGNEKAFAANSEGKYDLNQWNDNYWEKFENLLKWSQEKNIIVQIEIWDRFDHSRAEWLTDPFHPKNNVNYTYEASGLDSLYPNHPGSNEQPFFFSVPTLDNNQVLLPYQKAFVKKLLSISLNYDNVLYCIDNETKGVEEWAVFWADFIHDIAGEKQVYLTQMWDDWDIKSDMHKRTMDHPDRYQFIDMSQNSHNTGQQNWDNAQYIFDYIKDQPRPVNSTKIYGSPTSPWLNRGIDGEHAVQTFFRNVLGGFASSRFHRPPAGLGLSERSINAIRSIRVIEEKVKFWEVTPANGLLSGLESNEAFLAAREGEKYVIYFPGSGKVQIDLKGEYELNWLDVTKGSWLEEENILNEQNSNISPPLNTGSIGVMLKK